MPLGFQVSVGSIPGRAHIGSGNLLIGKNNQDAYVLEVFDDCIIATVQDGCSSGAHSEIGASLGGRLLSRLIYDSICTGALPAVTTVSEASIQLERIRKKLLTKLSKIANCLEIPICDCTHAMHCACFASKLVHDFFLFTTVGIVITKTNAIVFSIGDGIFALNGELAEIGPFPENAPPYLAYSLIATNTVANTDTLKFSIHAVLPTSALESALIATDGLRELIDKHDKTLPGKSQTVGDISQLWTDDRFFDDEHGELITPWLRLVNSEVVKITGTSYDARMERSLGLLSDDTTVIALRRKNGGATL